MDVLHRSDAGGVARIEIRRAALSNALDPAHLHALAAMIDGAGRAPGIGAVLLTGEGDRAFCAGLNLKAADAIAAERSGQGRTGLGAVLRAANACPVPLVARVNGACVAGGMGLLAACDVAIAAEDAAFGLPEIRHGLFPFVVLAGWHGRVTTGPLVGLAVTARRIAAREAVSMGLISEAVPRELLDTACRRALAVIRGIDPACLRPDPTGFEARIAAAEASTRRYRRQLTD